MTADPTSTLATPSEPSALREPRRTAHLSWIAWSGWLLFGVWAAVLLIWGLVQPDPYAQGWRLVVELAFLGRLVSVADGIASGFSKGYLLFQSGLQDIILLLIAYPPLVAVCEGEGRHTLVGRWLERVRQTAERQTSKVEPLGALGLWIFVFFPFWSTGALVGGVVGYLLGMRTWVVFCSVFLGHAISVVTLVYFFDAMASVAESFDSGLARFLPWIVLGLLIIGSLVSSRLKSIRQRPDRD